MPGKYILNDAGEPVLEPDLMTWAQWFEDADRVIETTLISDPDSLDPITVSTIFLGLDLSFGDPGGPVLWETMNAGGPYDRQGERYRTRDGALGGHRVYVDSTLNKVPGATIVTKPERL